MTDQHESHDESKLNFDLGEKSQSVNGNVSVLTTLEECEHVNDEFSTSVNDSSPQEVSSDITPVVVRHFPIEDLIARPKETTIQEPSLQVPESERLPSPENHIPTALVTTLEPESSPVETFESLALLAVSAANAPVESNKETSEQLKAISDVQVHKETLQELTESPAAAPAANTSYEIEKQMSLVFGTDLGESSDVQVETPLAVLADAVSLPEIEQELSGGSKLPVVEPVPQTATTTKEIPSAVDKVTVAEAIQVETRGTPDVLNELMSVPENEESMSVEPVISTEEREDIVRTSAATVVPASAKAETQEAVAVPVQPSSIPDNEEEESNAMDVDPVVPTTLLLPEVEKQSGVMLESTIGTASIIEPAKADLLEGLALSVASQQVLTNDVETSEAVDTPGDAQNDDELQSSAAAQDMETEISECTFGQHFLTVPDTPTEHLDLPVQPPLVPPLKISVKSRSKKVNRPIYSKLRTKSKCHICGHYIKRSSMPRHIKYVHGEMLIQCTICQRTFGRPDSGRYHLSLHHQIDSSQAKEFLVDVRKGDLPEESLLPNRRKLSARSGVVKTGSYLASIESFNCFDCDGTFLSITELFRHCEVHRYTDDGKMARTLKPPKLPSRPTY